VQGISTKERRHSEVRGVDERIGLKRILRRLAGGWSGFNWLKIKVRWRALVYAVGNRQVVAPRS
jgi:hypothetical protein